MGEKNTLLNAALAYAEMGYPVFPCWPGTKKPISKHGFKDAITDLQKIEKYWTNNPIANIGIPTQDLIVIDIDTIDGEKNPWLKDDPDKQIDLAKGEIQKTPRGGTHYVFKQPIGKHWRSTTSRLAHKVDTRADGGYIVVAPSIFEGKSYKWLEGMGLEEAQDQLLEPPEWLIKMLDQLAVAGDGAPKKTTEVKEGNAIPSGQRNSALASMGGAMRRVGMGESEILAALMAANENRCSPPLPDGEVEKIAWSVSRYEPDQISVAVTEDHYGQMFDEEVQVVEDEPNEEVDDPGPIPSRLLKVPGLIEKVTDYTMETAPYPDLALAFTNALSLMGMLAGRKVCDPFKNRTNLYLLALANSGVGKNHPRTVTQDILFEAGITNSLSDSFASGEGIEDRLFTTPNVLFQTDEIDGLMNAITKGRDPRFEGIMNVLLKMYTASASVYAMRVKAGRDSAFINQPSLSLFGTAIPSLFYGAISEKMMTNGFFARILVTEAGKRGEWQNAEAKDIPQDIIEIVKWWKDYVPGGGNLGNLHPKPKVIELTPEANEIMISFCKYADKQYTKTEKRGDNAAMAIWARANEKARRLYLCYAVSENHEKPVVSDKAADWATEFVDHQTKRMIFMASRHLSGSEFESRCKKILEFLAVQREKNGDKWVTYRMLSRKFRWKCRDHEEVRDALKAQGLIVTDLVPTKGRPNSVYKLAGNSERMNDGRG